MSLQQFNEYLNGGGGILLIVMTLIQIAPVKVNPWSWIAKKIRKLIYGPVETRLDSMEKKLDEREASNARYRIIRFNDEILQEKKHTKEHFDQILDDIKIYEDYCKDHPEYPNNKAVMAVDNIKATYRKCTQEHSFL